MFVGVLHLDYETRSTVELKASGVYNYARHPTTDIWLARYAFDDGPIEIWQPGEPCPARLYNHIASGATVCGHNVRFELEICNNIAAPRYGWPAISIEQCEDAMLLALTMAHPGALEKAVQAARLDIEKDMEGHRLMMRMARPRRVAADGSIVWWDQQERIDRLSAYCEQDVAAERALHHYANPLSPNEREIWLIDHEINERGVYIDIPLANAALEVATLAKAKLDQEISDVTHGWVRAVSDAGALGRWLRSIDIPADSVSKDKVVELLKVVTDPAAHRALELRQQGAKSSTAKIQRMLAYAGADGRIRHTMQQNAAGTGRWGGRVIQPHNLPRPELLKKDSQVEEAIVYVKTRDVAAIERVFGPPMVVLADLLRGLIAAPPGYELMAADWSSVEGRMLAWLAGEDWKIKAYRDFDAGIGDEIYRITAGGILGIAPKDVTGDERQAYGKVPELSCGYQGGVAAFDDMAATYGVRMAEHYDTVADTAPEDDFDAAWKRYHESKDRFPSLSAKAWVASEVVKVGWRRKHPAICAYWYALEEAALGAMREPGAIYGCGPNDTRRIRFRVQGNHLYCRLPSGRLLCYPWPELQMKKTPWGAKKEVVTYMTQDLAGRWVRTHTYGGKLCIAEGTPVLTDAGWVPIQRVTSTMRVWDGCAWVSHGGVVCNGVRPTIDAHGVRMTSDHEILTTEGWQRASQSAGYHRAASRLPYGGIVHWQRWEEIPLVGEMRLRPGRDDSRVRVEEDASSWGGGVLWVSSKRNHRQAAEKTRNVWASGLCGLAFYAGAVLSKITPCLVELWRKGNQRLSALARLVRGVLGGHGRHISGGAFVGADRQLTGVFSGELSMGHAPASGEQQKIEHPYRDTLGEGDRGASVSPIRDKNKHVALSAVSRLPARKAFHTAGCQEQVYDLINCGPRRRYVVRDQWGQPLIVHNCENVTQASCADLLRHALSLLRPTLYGVVLHVHDEVVVEVPQGQGSTTELIGYLCQLPEWAKGLPIAATAWRGPRFKKD